MRNRLFICGWLGAFLAASLTAKAATYRLPDPPRLSVEGYQLILDFEVGGGERYYNKFLQHPEWPGVESGVTIGIGYDCGYTDQSTILDDWRELAHDDLVRIAATAGVKGSAAKRKLGQVRDILIAWPVAENVFRTVDISRYYALTQRAFPGFDGLKSNAQAALVSLVFNRGSSMYGDSRREMRAIRGLVPFQDYRGIARQIRLMERLWDPKSGLIPRREAEAKLTESCAN